MEIQPIVPRGIEAFEPIQKSMSETAPSGGASFSSHLEKSLSEVNDLLRAADKGGLDMASGKSENLHEAMIHFEKAETAFKLLTQVRNKAIEAYHEIMRMQV